MAWKLPLLARWLNCFQYCSRCLRSLGHLMVLFVLLLTANTCWAVVGTYGPLLRSSNKLKAAGAGVLCVAFSLMVVMVLWSYFAAVLTDPGRVPPNWHPFADEQQAHQELERMSCSDYWERKDPRRPRFCKRCAAWKPERAHHCSVLGRCVLRMDHHCIWLVQTVGLKNYKFFLLFMLYTCVTCLFSSAMLVPEVVAFFRASRLQGASALVVLITVVLDGALAAALLGFLAVHAQLIRVNCTSIEMYEKDRIHPWPYNKGLRKNLEEVFGHRKLLWLLPLHSGEHERSLEDVLSSPSLLSGASCVA